MFRNLINMTIVLTNSGCLEDTFLFVCWLMIQLFFLKDKHQIDRAIQFVNFFSNASGLHLNINKCELIAIHDSELDFLCNIPVSVKYLGITITKDNNHNIQENFVTKFLKAKTNSQQWLQRDVSILEEFLNQTEFLSRVD